MDYIILGIANHARCTLSRGVVSSRPIVLFRLFWLFHLLAQVDAICKGTRVVIVDVALGTLASWDQSRIRSVLLRSVPTLHGFLGGPEEL